MYRLTSDWVWNLNSQKYLIYTKQLPLRPKFWFVLLYNRRFSRFKVVENWKCTRERLQMAWTLNSRKYHAYTKSLPRGPNFGPLRSVTSRFPDTRLSKIGKVGNDPRLTEHLTVKSTLHKVRTLEAQIFVRFALRPAVCKIQGYA